MVDGWVGGWIDEWTVHMLFNWLVGWSVGSIRSQAKYPAIVVVQTTFNISLQSTASQTDRRRVYMHSQLTYLVNDWRSFNVFHTFLWRATTVEKRFFPFRFCWLIIKKSVFRVALFIQNLCFLVCLFCRQNRMWKLVDCCYCCRLLALFLVRRWNGKVHTRWIHCSDI